MAAGGRELSNWVKKAAHEAGFDLAGIASTADTPELAYFPEWVAAGHAGDMKYLEARNETGELKRASLRHAAPWARSVIVCALNYNTAQPLSTDADEASRGWISRYAWGQRDYHDIMLPRLRQLEARLKDRCSEPPRTWCYVDTGPVVERVFARYAGIGWMGKNACVINQEIGSWLFLGVILTSLELEPGLPPPDRCGTCTRCLDACPTQAFVAPGKLDARRCISYLTIEKRGAAPEELRAGVGRHVFGCDICQEVCPWNREAPVTTEPGLQPRPELVNPALDWLAELSLEAFRERFRGSPVKRTKWAGLKRNVALAMGNSGNRRFLPVLRRLATDPEPTVAEHARWALQRLSQNKHDVSEAEQAK